MFYLFVKINKEYNEFFSNFFLVKTTNDCSFVDSILSIQVTVVGACVYICWNKEFIFIYSCKTWENTLCLLQWTTDIYVVIFFPSFISLTPKRSTRKRTENPVALWETISVTIPQMRNDNNSNNYGCNFFFGQTFNMNGSIFI